MKRNIKAWLFSIVRPLFVRDLDPNEDFACMQCGEPVFRRYLYCSRECADGGTV